MSDRLFAFLKNPVSKIGLSVGAVVYLLLLNVLTARDLHNSLFYGVWPALSTLIFFALLSIFPRHVLKTFVALFVAIASAAIFFKFKYNAVITEDIVLSTWLNDASLSMEMVSWNLLIWFLLTAIMPIAYIIAVPIKPVPVFRQATRSLLLCLCLLAAIAGIFHVQGFSIRKAGQIRDPQIANSLTYFSPIDGINSGFRALKAHRAFLKAYAHLPQLSKTYHYTLAPEMQDVFVLVIVGETARGDRFSLNGYTKNTNPELATVQNLHSFANVSSCNTLTVRSLKCVFGRVTDENRSKGITESAFTDVFRALGFTIDIYSLQGLTDIYNYLSYDKLVSKYAVLKRSASGAKDEALLPFLQEAIDSQQGRKLVILHTLGSHQTYLDRTNDADRHFKPYCAEPDVQKCSPELLNNAYDNTIIATDKFLYNSIKMLENKKAVVLYVSDHGESLGENGVYYHGLPLSIAPKEQFHVPMIVWLSPPLANSDFGRKMEAGISALDKKAHFSHDNFFHSVLGCAGISSSDGGIDSKLNLCGGSAVPGPSGPAMSVQATNNRIE